MITTVISDFGGVLTTPLGNAFAAWSKESGVPLEDLGAAMAKATEDHDGQHPLFMLERGELTEIEFLERLQSRCPPGATWTACSTCGGATWSATRR